MDISLILSGVVIWYDFPVSLFNKTSKAIVGADMSMVMAFVDKFLVTEATTDDDPIWKTLLVIVITN
jgi:hypothetical protein